MTPVNMFIYSSDYLTFLKAVIKIMVPVESDKIEQSMHTHSCFGQPQMQSAVFETVIQGV
jgi:hypothetical protein